MRVGWRGADAALIFLGPRASLPALSCGVEQKRAGKDARGPREKALAMGPVDVLFNNAGYGLAGAFEAASDARASSTSSTPISWA